MANDIVVLDATLRDGGLINNHYFDDDFVKKIYKMNVAAGTDCMEFGYRASKEIFSPEKYGKWKFSSDDDIRKIVGSNDTKLKLSIMVDADKCDYKNDICEKSDSPVDIIRVSMYQHQLSEAIKIIENSYKKGYKVTCNIMAISKCSLDQVKAMITELAKTPVSVIYIVDSFGAFYPDNIKRYMECYHENIGAADKEIGIHIHNNQQCAFANTLIGLSEGAKWLDATVYGMGRGAGNCHLESLFAYLKEDRYRIDPVLDFIQDEMIRDRQINAEWGYNTYYLITGAANRHPKEAIQATKNKCERFLEFKKRIEGQEC